MHIYSFLSGRLARLKIDNDVGDWIDSFQGTSAGTSLGPLLFITYLHDVPKCIMPKYADDLAAISTGKEIKSITTNLQHATDSLLQWAKREGMVLNSAKTKVMIFGDSTDPVTITLDGSAIENVSSYKYLGVELDPLLTFNRQVEYAACKAKRASAKVFSLISGSHGVPVDIGIGLYKSLVRPHLEYALPVWANISEKDTQLLEDVQLQCLRKVIGAKSHSSSVALEVISGILPFRFRKRELCCREYVRTISNTSSRLLLNLFHSSTRVGLRFCPLEYIWVLSRELEKEISGCSLSVQRVSTVAKCLFSSVSSEFRH